MKLSALNTLPEWTVKINHYVHLQNILPARSDGLRANVFAYVCQVLRKKLYPGFTAPKERHQPGVSLLGISEAAEQIGKNSPVMQEERFFQDKFQARESFTC
jgi:hypothetical protein